MFLPVSVLKLLIKKCFVFANDNNNEAIVVSGNVSLLPFSKNYFAYKIKLKKKSEIVLNKTERTMETKQCKHQST